MKDYTILGIDVGHSTCETNLGVIFDSKITDIEPLSTADKIKIDGKIYWLGDGNYDTTHRKVDKENYINFLYGALALSTDTVNNYIVLGLPLSQYKEDKTNLINIILANREKTVEINGVEKPLIINDVEVFPEGVSTLADDEECIVVDIGGGTTDCALVVNERGKRKIIKPISIPKGTIKIFEDFANKLNGRYGLDLDISESERILQKGLFLDGKKVEIDFALEMYKDFTNTLISKLQLNYPLRTNKISLTGGGATILYNYFKDKFGESVTLQENSIFANANAYYELGCSVWQ